MITYQITKTEVIFIISVFSILTEQIINTADGNGKKH